jgi:PAS domain S-box-containing protein
MRARPGRAIIRVDVGHESTSLLMAESELEHLFDLAPDLLCIAGFDGYLKRVNRAFERALGYPHEELMARPFLELIPPEEVQGSIDVLSDLAAGKDVVGYEHRIICADGSMLWIQWTTKTMPDRDYVFGAARDVTDRRRAEDELRAARRTAEASRDEHRMLAEEQAALRRVATLVARQAAPAEIFAAVAEEAGWLLGIEAIVLLRHESDDAVSVVATWGELETAVPVGKRLSLEWDDIASRVLRTGRPARLDDSSIAPGARCATIRSAVGTPITADGRLWGVMIAASPRPGPLPADTEARIGAFTELVATAISNVQARADLAASRARVVAAGDEERRRVVRDLHDGAQQRLVHTVITLKLATRALEMGNDALPALLTEALEQAERATEEVRELAHGILPAVLTHGGLRAAVDALASRAPVPVELDVSAGRLPAAAEGTAYFVVAEALTNVAKHSSAAGAAVTARVEDDVLQVRVRDDGCGGARSDGRGLLGLADRLAVLGGRLVVESPTDGGTIVAADIPLDQAATSPPPGGND